MQINTVHKRFNTASVITVLYQIVYNNFYTIMTTYFGYLEPSGGQIQGTNFMNMSTVNITLRQEHEFCKN